MENYLSLSNFSFMLTFLVLSFSTILTGIESLATKNLKLRAVLTLETFVSLVAGYIYYKYLINQPNEVLSINYRYLDWFITTPFLLLSLCIMLNTSDEFPWTVMCLIIVLNQLMIIFGYFSERDSAFRIKGWILSTACLVGVFVLIAVYFEAINKGLYWFFLVLWSLYGIIYFLPKDTRTILNNLLDLVAKAGFGIWTWLIATGLIKSSYSI